MNKEKSVKSFIKYCGICNDEIKKEYFNVPVELRARVRATDKMMCSIRCLNSVKLEEDDKEGMENV